MSNDADRADEQDPLDSPDDFESDGKNGKEPEALPDDAVIEDQ